MWRDRDKPIGTLTNLPRGRKQLEWERSIIPKISINQYSRNESILLRSNCRWQRGNYVRLKNIPPSLFKAGVLFSSTIFSHNVVKIVFPNLKLLGDLWRSQELMLKGEHKKINMPQSFNRENESSAYILDTHQLGPQELVSSAHCCSFRVSLTNEDKQTILGSSSSHIQLNCEAITFFPLKECN